MSNPSFFAKWETLWPATIWRSSRSFILLNERTYHLLLSKWKATPSVVLFERVCLPHGEVGRIDYLLLMSHMKWSCCSFLQSHLGDMALPIWLLEWEFNPSYSPMLRRKSLTCFYSKDWLIYMTLTSERDTHHLLLYEGAFISSYSPIEERETLINYYVRGLPLLSIVPIYFLSLEHSQIQHLNLLIFNFLKLVMTLFKSNIVTFETKYWILESFFKSIINLIVAR